MRAPIPARPTPRRHQRELVFAAVSLLSLLGMMWIPELVDQYVLGGELDKLGIRPREPSAVFGIVLWPILHQDFSHLLANTIGIAIFGTLTALLSRRDFWLVATAATLLGGALVWALARGGTVHIGASGIVFGYFGYVVLRGIFERKPLSIVVSLAVIVLWGGTVWGMLPMTSGAGVSWEGHLFGFVAGGLVARLWRPRAQPRTLEALRSAPKPGARSGRPAA